MRFTIQAGDALSNSSTNQAYYWRVRAKDPASTGGTDTYGLWSDTYSFRVNTSLKISRWLQTADAQLDDDTFSDTTTDGSGSAILNTVLVGSAFSSNTSYTVPVSTTELTVKAWGAGGGGGAGGTSGGGGDGGGGAFATSTIAVTGSESLDIIVGQPGTFGNYDPGDNSGSGGGGGGRSAIERTGTPLIIAAGGGGGGGGDNSSTTAGGAGGEADSDTGTAGSPSSNAGGGGGGTQLAGGSGGTSNRNPGTAGGSEYGGAGADGRSSAGVDGSENNGGAPNGGDGGTGNIANGYAGGGGGGDGYYGGGGGGGSYSGNAGGGGGGGGSSYVTGSGTYKEGGSGISAANKTDEDYIAGKGDGGSAGAASTDGSDGTAGLVIVGEYQTASSGTIMSPAIDFDWQVGMDSWKEFNWTEVETNGTVAVKLYYNNGSDCDTVIPNAALAGNESGFSSGPIDISGLNTTTYNRICLQSTLTNSTGTPYLDDWYVSWGFDVSGTVYLENKSTQATTGNGGQCNSSTENLTLRVNGATPLTTYCSSSDGSFTFTGVEATAGDLMTIYSTDSTDKSNRVYTSDGNSDTLQDTYKNSITVADLTDSTMDIVSMIDYDNDQNSTDMLFDAENASPDALTWESGTEVYVPSGQTFEPNGNTDGHDIEIDGVWTAQTGETINLDGNFILDTGGTFNPSTSTLTFDGNSGTEDLTTDGTGSLYNLIIDDGGGSLTIEVEDPLVVDNDVTITDGTLDVKTGESNQISVGRNWSNSDTFIEQTGTVIFDGAADATLDSGCSDEDTCTNDSLRVLASLYP